MHLGVVCDSLKANKGDSSAFDKVYSDFISTFSTGTFEFSSISNDQNLETFVELTLEPFSRINPGSEDSLAYTKLFANFVTSLISSSPNIASLVSKHFPLQKVLSTACNDIPVQTAISLIKLSAFASSGGYLSVIQNETLSAIFRNYIKLLQVPATCPFTMCSLSGLLRSHPIFLSFVRASADLKLFRDITTTTLSCDDHLCVVASLSALLSIFPRSIDSATTKCAALHAVSVSGDNMLLLRSAVSLLTDLSVVTTITEEEFSSIVQCAIAANGMKAFILYDGLNRILMNRETSIPLTGSLLNVDSIINVLVSTQNGFLAQTVLAFIDQLHFQRDDIFDNLKDSSAHAYKAIRILSSPPNTLDIELLEGAATILKFFVLSIPCFTQIKDVLSQQEETLFVAFQRHIESSEPYVSLLLFLFLSVAARYLDLWKKRIRLSIIDSQFSALLAHVIESSTDRKCLVDAISALSQISQFEFGEKICDHSVIFDSIISGFMTINLIAKEDKKKIEESVENRVQQIQQVADGMKAQIECDELEIQSLYSKQEKLEQENEELRTSIHKLEEAGQSSDSTIQQLTTNTSDQESQISSLTNEVNRLSKENDTNKLIISQNNQKIKELTSLLDEYKAKEPDHLKTERANAAFEVKVGELSQQINSLQQKIQEQGAANESLKIKLRELKQEYVSKSNDFQLREVERGKAQLEINDLKNQLSLSEDSRKNAHDKAHLIKEKLRETLKVLEELQQRDIDNKREIDDYERRNSELLEQLNAMIAEKKQFELIAQFVHRITDDSPIPPEQLLSMLDDTK